MSISLLIELCFLLQAQKAENIIEHEAEIYARPARTWFQTERQKRQAAKEAKEVATSAPDIQAAGKGVAARKGGSQGRVAATGRKGKLTKQEQQALRVKKNTFMEVGIFRLLSNFTIRLHLEAEGGSLSGPGLSLGEGCSSFHLFVAAVVIQLRHQGELCGSTYGSVHSSKFRSVAMADSADRRHRLQGGFRVGWCC